MYQIIALLVAIVLLIVLVEDIKKLAINFGLVSNLHYSQQTKQGFIFSVALRYVLFLCATAFLLYKQYPQFGSLHSFFTAAFFSSIFFAMHYASCTLKRKKI